MNVTDQVLQSHIQYGGSDNTNPSGLSASYSLNYARGASITKPDTSSIITHIPFTFKFQDAVGLFGAENYYHLVRLKLTGVSGCVEDPGWDCLSLVRDHQDDALTDAISWDPLLIDPKKDLETRLGYEPAVFNRDLPKLHEPLVGVTLKNNKTGNIYVDDWLDVCFYDHDKKQVDTKAMWVSPHSYFYIGFHARNTRRLPYDVEVTIGKQYIPASEANQHLIHY